MVKKKYTKHFKHSLYHHPLNHIWVNMRQRCNNKNNRFYKRYGERRIKVSSDWDQFINFYNWSINNGWKEGLFLDRENNDGNYEPTNCRWVTPKINSNNRKDTIIVNHNGNPTALRLACDELGLKGKLVWQMMNRKGLSFDQAVKHYQNV